MANIVWKLKRLVNRTLDNIKQRVLDDKENQYQHSHSMSIDDICLGQWRRKFFSIRWFIYFFKFSSSSSFFSFFCKIYRRVFNGNAIIIHIQPTKKNIYTHNMHIYFYDIYLFFKKLRKTFTNFNKILVAKMMKNCIFLGFFHLNYC